MRKFLSNVREPKTDCNGCQFVIFVRLNYLSWLSIGEENRVWEQALATVHVYTGRNHLVDETREVYPSWHLRCVHLQFIVEEFDVPRLMNYISMPLLDLQ